MKKSGLAGVGAALLLTLGFAAATVEPAAAAPSSSVATPAAELFAARWDRRDYCRNVVHYGWKNRRCVRVQQLVCRNRYGRTYIADRRVTRAPAWRCRYR